MSLTRSRPVALVAASGLVAGVAAVASFSIAQAGHENAVLEAELTGAAEVGEDGSTGVGDPDGAGHAFVFGIDIDPTTLCYIITMDSMVPMTTAG